MSEDRPLRMNKIIPVQYQKGYHYVRRYVEPELVRKPGPIPNTTFRGRGRAGRIYPYRCTICNEQPIYKTGWCFECCKEMEERDVPYEN